MWKADRQVLLFATSNIIDLTSWKSFTQLYLTFSGKETATHSSIPAWRIPGTEPGGLPSLGTHRAGRSISTWLPASSAFPQRGHHSPRARADPPSPAPPLGNRGWLSCAGVPSSGPRMSLQAGFTGIQGWGCAGRGNILVLVPSSRHAVIKTPHFSV